MNRLFALVLLIGAMFGLAELDRAMGGFDLPLSVTDTLQLGVTFAGIGFVVLAAHVFASLGGSVPRVPLPRVTGYILAGIALGPSVAGVLSTDVVADMEVFNTLAVAFIALEAGLELKFSAIRKVGRSLLSIVLFKVPLAWLMVGGAFLAVSGLMPVPLETSAALAIALTIGAISVGTSPAVSVAVISEMGAKGKAADLILSISVFKDIVMILMLAIAMAIGRVLLTDGASMDADIFLSLGKKIVFSIGVGVGFGLVLIAYMRWVRWEPVLTLLIVAYGGAWLSDVLHLKMLLVFIAAGFVVSNFSRYGHDLHKPLTLLALPVFIVFFTTIGAGIDLTQTAAVLPVAAILFAVRVLLMYVSARFGGKLAKDPPEFSGNIWIGFISQAGVALGLLFIAVDELPQVAGPLGELGLALIALNLLIGPVMLRLALSRAARLEAATATPTPTPVPLDADATPSTAHDRVAGGEPTVELHAAAAVEAEPQPTPDESDWGPGPEDEELKEAVEKVEQALDDALREVREGVIEPWLEGVDVRLAALIGEPPEDPGTIHAAVEPVELTGAAKELRAVARRVRDVLAGLPGKLARPIMPYHLELAEDATLSQRMAKRLLELRGASNAKRRVAVRLISRRYVEGVFVVGLEQSLVSLARAEAARIVQLDRVFHERRDAAQVAAGEERPEGELPAPQRWPVEDLRSACEDAAQRLVTHLERAAMRALGRLGHALRYANTPAAASKHRYVDVAQDVDNALKRLDQDGPAWDRALDAVAGRTRIRVVLLELEDEVRTDTAQVVRTWTSGQQEDVSAIVSTVRRALAEASEKLPERLTKCGRAEAMALLGEDAAELERVVTRQALPRVDALRHEDAGERAFTAVTRRLQEQIEVLDEQWPTVPHLYDPQSMSAPSEVPAQNVAMRSIARRHLFGELKWAYGDAGAQAERMIDRVAIRLGEVAGVITYGLRTAVDEIAGRPEGEEVAEVGAQVAIGCLGRALKIVDGLSRELSTRMASMPETVLSLTREAFVHTYGRLLGDVRGREEGAAARRPSADWRRRVRQFASNVRESWAQARQRLRDVYQRVVESDAARAARVRTGREVVDAARMKADVERCEVRRDQRAKLPYVLEKLFDSSALDTPQILAGADDQRAAIERAWERFDAGEPTAALLVGAAGSGKTSVAHVLLRELAGRRLIDVSLNPLERTENGFCSSVGAEAGAFQARTFPTLRDALLRSSSRHTVLLDGFEQLFERTPDGVAHARSILHLIASTRHAVCWVVAINEPTARLLDHLLDLHGYFTDRIEFPPLPEESLLELIEARCRLAGFSVHWPDSPRDHLWQLLWPANWGRSREDLRRRFGRQLARASAGNTRDAMTLFINAIDRIDDERLHIEPVRDPGLPWFDQLGRDAHRLAALTVLCGSLNRVESVFALRWTPDRLDAALSRLVGSGLVVEFPGQADRWRMRDAVWRRVVEQLVARNELIAGAVPLGGGR